MMRLSQFLKNSAKAGLLFSLSIFISIFLSSCQSQIESTYKEKEIPSIVKEICLNEYELDVKEGMVFDPTSIFVEARKKVTH